MEKEKTDVLISKLKPFWEKFFEFDREFEEKVRVLETEMNNCVKVGVKLEFIRESECVGVGAKNYKDRKDFPLISDSELG